MSQQDFEITAADANTGITVRAAINAALQALASCSSGATEPATRYPYQWWADTTTGFLKQRNAANSAWITIINLANPGLAITAGKTITVTQDTSLDEAVAMSSKAPKASPAFTGDVTMPGTGIWNSAGNVGIGTTTPAEKLEVGGIRFTGTGIAALPPSGTAAVDGLGGNLRLFSYVDIIFRTGASGSEMMYIKNTGNVGIGTTTPTSLLTVAGPISTQAPATKTAAYSLIATDSSLIFNGTASIILTLQAASSYTGRILYVKTIAAFTVDSASANVAPLGSATAGTAILAAIAGKWAMLQSDGANWVVMAGN